MELLEGDGLGGVGEEDLDLWGKARRVPRVYPPLPLPTIPVPLCYFYAHLVVWCEDQ